MFRTRPKPRPEHYSNKHHNNTYNFLTIHPVDETERTSAEPSTFVSPGVDSSTLPVSFSEDAVQFASLSSTNNVKASLNLPRAPPVPFVTSATPCVSSTRHVSSAVPSAVAHCTYQPGPPVAVIKSAKKELPPSSTNSSKVVQGNFTAQISSFSVPVLQPSCPLHKSAVPVNGVVGTATLAKVNSAVIVSSPLGPMVPSRIPLHKTIALMPRVAFLSSSNSSPVVSTFKVVSTAFAPSNHSANNVTIAAEATDATAIALNANTAINATPTPISRKFFLI